VTLCSSRHRFTQAAAVRPRTVAALRSRFVSFGPSNSRDRRRRAGPRRALPKTLVVCVALSLASLGAPRGSAAGTNGLASWYGEEHRGKLMANGHRFNPDKLTAASWFYPLGTKVEVTLASTSQPPRSVVVTITDRGPAWEYVREGRTIDLSHASFKQLARPRVGLLAVAVQPVNPPGANVQAVVASSPEPPSSVVATNMERGPAWAFAREGRTIDLSGGSFKRLGNSDLDLFAVGAQTAK